MSQDTTLPPLPDERAEFEEWCTTELNYGYDFAKDAKGNYTHDATETAWYAWEARAARAAIAAQAPEISNLIEADKMLREIGAMLAAQTRYQGSYVEIVRQMLDAQAPQPEQALEAMTKNAEELGLYDEIRAPQQAPDSAPAPWR